MENYLYICNYCGKPTETTGSWSIPNFSEQGTYYTQLCKNHYPARVSTHIHRKDGCDNIESIKIYKKKKLYVKIENDNMTIFINKYLSQKNTVLNLPVDNSLTPENMEDKVKTYLSERTN